MGPVEVAAILAPVLMPFLRRAGSEARSQLASRVGDAAAGSAADLWERLRGRITGSDPHPSDAVVESRLAAALQEDPGLLEEARTTVRLVVEGDHNTVQQGRTNINISGGHDIQIGRLSD